MISISDTDIDIAQSLLLREKGEFDKERRTVIQDLEGFDVQASPGSGKTTTMLAKLLLISQQLPLPNNKGICVLTHTNVAINEIKDRLGTHFSKLFVYPNFFGTFQSFVHKYLANEIIENFFGIRPKVVSDDFFNRSLNMKLYSHINTPWDKDDKIRDFLYSIKKSRGIPLEEVHSILYFNFEKEGFFITGREKPVLANPNNSKYPILKKIFYDIYEEGSFRYADPYYISLKYIKQFKSIYQSLLSNRFEYVFVDEMQDTDSKQCALLNILFDRKKTIVQRFGDVNQSIFQSSVSENICWDKNKKIHPISGSKRFSQKIADKLVPISVENFEVVGTKITPYIDPYIIIFDDSKIESVKDEFMSLIKEHNLLKIRNESKNPFKAIGWVKDHDKYHGISSYWPDVILDKSSTKTIFYENIYSYIQSLKLPLDTNAIDANSIRKALLNCLVQLTREINQKNKNGHYFDPRSFLKYVNTINEQLHEELLLKLTCCCKKLVLKQSIIVEVRNIAIWLFPQIFDIDKDEIENHRFVIGNELDEKVKKVGLEDGNLYMKDGVDLEFSTIHGIKGETHTATLYLETFHNGYDLHRLKKELTKSEFTKTKKELQIKTRKMAYVAMSRPTHLLCLAMHKKTIGSKGKEIELGQKYIAKLQKKWKVVEL